MIAIVLGSGPSIGVENVIVPLAGTAVGPPEALPPTTHQTMVISVELALLTCQRRKPDWSAQTPTKVTPSPVTGTNTVGVTVKVGVFVRVTTGGVLLGVNVVDGVGVLEGVGVFDG